MSPRLSVADVTAALGRPPDRRPRPGTIFQGVTIDSRRLRPGELFVALRGERYDGQRFLPDAVEAGATGAVGRDAPFEGRDRIAFWPVEEGRTALQALARWHRARLPVRVAAVTGSNGKTTTKELVAAVLAQRFATVRTVGNLNNQVGVPLTLLELEAGHEWAVVELGMNRPGEIAPLARISRPGIGIVTNVAASHLEGMGSIEAVLDEKLALGRALPPDGLLIYCGDQPLLRDAVRDLGCRTLAYGLEPHNDLRPERWRLDDDGRGVLELGGRIYRLRLVGRHNVVNALAAVAVGLEAGLDETAIACGLAEPEGLPMRMQLERWGEITALVDCYNANPDSVLSAASSLADLAGIRRRVAVLGEMLELGERSAELHEELGRSLAGLVDVVIAVDGGAEPIARGAAAEGLPSERADRDEAVRWLIENLAPGDAVLFKASRGAALEEVVARVREACVNGVTVVE
ncbi:MAG: UDP-N-acetylmuramoyl-tripeptide--D-alanyl-D-alanine ligase, partial [Gemmatimonadota bacterium]